MSGAEPVELSLVICTRDRASRLPDCLERVEGLRSARRWELVLVDNGSRDETPQVIAAFAARFAGRVVAVREPRPGLGNARNAGLAAARGEIVGYTDDDCYVEPDYVDAMLAAFAESPRLGFVGGRILPWAKSDARITLMRHTEPRVFPAGAFVRPGVVHGANLAFRRQALEDIGGFDPAFGPGALFVCDDVDALARVTGAGWDGAFDPRPTVYHHHGRKRGTDEKRLMRSYDRGRGAYYVKCLLDPGLRATYRRSWLEAIRRQPVPTTLREVAAGVEYLVRRRLGAGHAEAGGASRR